MRDIGLLCLGVEFYRIRAVDCPFSGSSQAQKNSENPEDFHYLNSTSCRLKCSSENGPKSPMRGGAADNLYVVPAPTVLTFGTATLLAAACSIHAILCLLSMWSKVVKINGKTNPQNDESVSVNTRERDEGTTGASNSAVDSINKKISHFLSMIAIPIFGGAGVMIIIIGEINFFSKQVRYQTEPMASVGKPSNLDAFIMRCLTFIRSMGSHRGHRSGNDRFSVSYLVRRNNDCRTLRQQVGGVSGRARKRQI